MFRMRFLNVQYFVVQLSCKLEGSFGNETVCFKDAESLACTYICMYGWMDVVCTIISRKYTTMNLSSSTKGVGVFSTVVIFPIENMPTSHALSLALGMYACSDSAMPLLSCT